MTVIDVAKDILQKIKNDVAIDAWCMSKYSKPISAFLGVGLSPNTAPAESDIPLVIVTECSMTKNVAGTPGTATITLGWEVLGQGMTQENGVSVLDGLIMSSELGELIADAVSVVTAEYTVESVEITPASTEEWGPRFPGMMTISIRMR
jgi:hypothetical protein